MIYLQFETKSYDFRVAIADAMNNPAGKKNRVARAVPYTYT